MKLVADFIKEQIPYEKHLSVFDAKNVNGKTLSDKKRYIKVSDEKVAQRRNLFIMELKKWDYSATRDTFYDEDVLFNMLKQAKENTQWK